MFLKVKKYVVEEQEIVPGGETTIGQHIDSQIAVAANSGAMIGEIVVAISEDEWRHSIVGTGEPLLYRGDAQTVETRKRMKL